MSLSDARRIIDLWREEGLRNIRISGGEPTLWKHLITIVRYAKNSDIKRIAISSNGSAPFELYQELVDAGVNDFSISLDSCCSATGNKMAGGSDIWSKVVANIVQLSKLTYVTVGAVLTDANYGEINPLIDFASKLGVADIRLITAAHTVPYLPKFSNRNGKHPILRYRLENMLTGRPIRGISQEDNPKCPLVLDDMAVLNNKHYPCIIYLREHGAPIGFIGPDMRAEREKWYLSHNCYEDEICNQNCLDVCVDYNNRMRCIGAQQVIDENEHQN